MTNIYIHTFIHTTTHKWRRRAVHKYIYMLRIRNIVISTAAASAVAVVVVRRGGSAQNMLDISTYLWSRRA